MNNTTLQLTTLKKYFPKLKYIKLIPYSFDGFEGIAIIPKWQKVASTYPEAVALVWKLLAKKRNPNYNYVTMDASYIRRADETDKTLASLNQKGDYYTLTVQMGNKYRGKTIENVRKDLPKNEVLLGAFEVGYILLSNPSLLKYNGVFEGIDCAGDEYSYNGDGVFSRSLSFCVVRGEFWFDGRYLGVASGRFGCASGRCAAT